ncbi:hypothetical protein A1Q2_01772 [Trichosporon asahii var. asahii CBS 8904]|uniref:t-SNARE coiled-coil homology domain-containing protein n=1 Tax=Trichosporon asahii var. asahii (strain CBS 8904) TaxID=1220162 RepID=K1W4X1_TRIAC|nr:hypothetical protein A1Q2_01772 [Trichosporon asahii var. asahii CBS 8904]
MSRDPYTDAKSEVEANIGNLITLLDSYERIKSTAPGSTSLSETVEELQTTLGLLETDLEDLEECVRVVEDHGDRWGLASAEVRERRIFVDRRLRTQVTAAASLKDLSTRYQDIEAQNEEVDRWEREEQQVGRQPRVGSSPLQMLMRQQDSTLGVISGTRQNLASQAGLIGQEVNEHNVMIEDLSSHVDSTQSRLTKVTRTLNDFIRKNEARGASPFSS